MTSVKFCGLMRPEDARLAGKLGASHAGVIFAPGSRRRVSTQQAKSVFSALPDSVRKVGVFRDAPLAGIVSTAAEAGLDAVQLHGAFDTAAIRELRALFSGAIWLVAGIDPASRSLSRHVLEIATETDAVLLDTSVAGLSGGSGVAFDWIALANDTHALSAIKPVIVAGGLTPLNVVNAIRALSPAVVDVSSGVEAAPGIKDHNLMRTFAQAVRSAS
ncbi:MAG: phosphoribosylanthranilate isomerase [Gemmatimonadaceae bacterium]